MSTKEKKPSLGLIWIMLFLSIAIIAYGFYLKGRRDSFLKTDGTFERYSDYIETDDDGYKEVKYRWYYSYNVNGTDYELSSSGNLSPHGPKYEIVLYNPEDPSESILENDKSVFVITLFGSIFLGASLLAAVITKWNPKKKDERLYDEPKGEVETDRPPDDEPIEVDKGRVDKDNEELLKSVQINNAYLKYGSSTMTKEEYVKTISHALRIEKRIAGIICIIIGISFTLIIMSFFSLLKVINELSSKHITDEKLVERIIELIPVFAIILIFGIIPTIYGIVQVFKSIDRKKKEEEERYL